MARRPWPWASRSCTRAWWRRARSANRPVGAASSDARTGTCRGRVCSCGSSGSASGPGSGARRQARWRATHPSTALPRFCHRWKRSATCTASGAPHRAPSAYAPERSRQITSTPGWARSQAASGCASRPASRSSGAVVSQSTSSVQSDLTQPAAGTPVDRRPRPKAVLLPLAHEVLERPDAALTRPGATIDAQEPRHARIAVQGNQPLQVVVLPASQQ